MLLAEEKGTDGVKQQTSRVVETSVVSWSLMAAALALTRW